MRGVEMIVMWWSVASRWQPEVAIWNKEEGRGLARPPYIMNWRRRGSRVLQVSGGKGRRVE